MTPIGTMDPSSLTVTKDDASVKLTPSQYAIFDALYRAKGRTLSKLLLQDVVESVMRSEINSNVVDVQINRTRHKLVPLGLVISNTWGKGYFLPKTELEVLPAIEWIEDIPAREVSA